MKKHSEQEKRAAKVTERPSRQEVIFNTGVELLQRMPQKRKVFFSCKVFIVCLLLFSLIQLDSAKALLQRAMPVAQSSEVSKLLALSLLLSLMTTSFVNMC